MKIKAKDYIYLLVWRGQQKSGTHPANKLSLVGNSVVEPACTESRPPVRQVQIKFAWTALCVIANTVIYFSD